VLMGFPGAGRKPIRIAKARDRHYSARRFAALRNDESVSSDPAGERARSGGLLCPASPKKAAPACRFAQRSVCFAAPLVKFESRGKSTSHDHSLHQTVFAQFGW
jgi:hypothetical protein